MTDPSSFYEFHFPLIQPPGQTLSFSELKGKVVFIVNTASRCGFTKQYQALEALYQRYKNQGFVLIGVPCNDFGQQEPGTSEEILDFCQMNYGVTFPLTEKTSVSGQKAHPFYQWAKKKLGWGTAPKWNFHKYLINKEGELVDYFSSPTSPESKRVIQAIEKCL